MKTTAQILDKRWGIRLVPASELPRGTDGECDDPSKRGKEIRIYNKMNDERTLAILIHEMLHAADWHKDESFVEQFAEQVARVAVRKLGYRRETK